MGGSAGGLDVHIRLLRHFPVDMGVVIVEALCGIKETGGIITHEIVRVANSDIKKSL